MAARKPTTAEKVSGDLKKMLAKQKAVKATPSKTAAKGKVTRGNVYYDARHGVWCINLIKTLPCGTKLVACMTVADDLDDEEQDAAEALARKVKFPNPFSF